MSAPLRPPGADPAARSAEGSPVRAPADGAAPAPGWRRRAWLRAAALLAALPAGPGAWAAAIIGVRVWPAQDYTRLTIESDSALQAAHFVTPDGPQRLVVEIQGLDLSPALRELVGKVRPDDPFIAALRVGQYQPKVVRLVLDLKQPVKPQQFQLPPVAAYQHRFLLDLYPSLPRDPLAQLISERDDARREAARRLPPVTGPLPGPAAGTGADGTATDPLGELIGRVDRPGSPAAGGAGAATSPAAPGATSAPAAAALPGTTASAPAAAVAPGTAAPAVATTAPVPVPVPVPVPGRSVAPPPPPDAAERERIDRLLVVALDPGHGGEDPGAIGPGGLREKDVVLQVALKLRDRLNSVSTMRAMLTRDGDFFVPLHERVRKARRVQADLFVSIHADAFFTPEARGASVFALSEKGASSAAARWMATKENAADGVGGLNVAASVKDPDVLRTLLDMSTAAQIKDSLRLGREVLERIGQVGALHKRKVEQAGFAVLKAPDIPSILVETAFISNPEEEAKLRDDAYQDRLVEALFNGIRRYFARNPPLARNRV